MTDPLLHAANRLIGPLFTNEKRRSDGCRQGPLSFAEPGGKIVTYSYDAANRRVAMSAYGKGTFTYSYDAANRQVKVEIPSSN